MSDIWWISWQVKRTCTRTHTIIRNFINAINAINRYVPRTILAYLLCRRWWYSLLFLFSFWNFDREFWAHMRECGWLVSIQKPRGQTAFKSDLRPIFIPISNDMLTTVLSWLKITHTFPSSKAKKAQTRHYLDVHFY